MLKRFVLALALAAVPALAHAQAISLGQATVLSPTPGTAIFNETPGSETLTFAGSPANGSLVCAIYQGNTTSVHVASVTGAGATFTLAKLVTGGNAGPPELWCGVANGSGAAITITLDAQETNGNVRAAIVNYTNGGSTWGTPSTNTNGAFSNAGSLTTHPSGTTTPGQANNVCIGALKGSGGTYTSAFTTGSAVVILDDGRSAAAYIIQTAATTNGYSPTSLAGEDSSTLIACIDSSGGGGGGGTASGRKKKGCCD